MFNLCKVVAKDKLKILHTFDVIFYNYFIWIFPMSFCNTNKVHL